MTPSDERSPDTYSDLCGAAEDSNLPSMHGRCHGQRLVDRFGIPGSSWEACHCLCHQRQR